MTVRRLVSLFSCFSIVPVEVSEVRDQIVEWGYHESIKIAPFTGPVSNLRGMLLEYKWVAPYGAEVSQCIIRYNSEMSKDWQRLTCIKELIHSMDLYRLRVNSKEKASLLLEKLSLNGQLNEGMGIPALFEEIATYQALAVLCPDEAIEKFRKKGTSFQDVAVALDIPPQYAFVAMQDDWYDTREKFIGFSE